MNPNPVSHHFSSFHMYNNLCRLAHLSDTHATVALTYIHMPFTFNLDFPGKMTDLVGWKEEWIANRKDQQKRANWSTILGCDRLNLKVEYG